MGVCKLCGAVMNGHGNRIEIGGVSRGVCDGCLGKKVPLMKA